jgi:hypothetical protein
MQKGETKDRDDEREKKTTEATERLHPQREREKVNTHTQREREKMITHTPTERDRQRERKGRKRAKERETLTNGVDAIHALFDNLLKHVLLLFQLVFSQLHPPGRTGPNGLIVHHARSRQDRHL